MTRHEIGPVEAFPEGRGRKVDVDGIEIAVFNLGDGWYGIQNTCPHKRFPLHPTGNDKPWSRELEDDIECGRLEATRLRTERGEVDADAPSVLCPWHHLEWDLETGENDLMDVRIATYDVEAVDGTVYVEI